LFTAWRCHAFITDSTLQLVAAEKRHRQHAIIEQVNADLKDSALAHMPSGSFAANAEQCLKPVDEREGRTFPVIE
jgi:hypothetical protein